MAGKIIFRSAEGDVVAVLTLRSVVPLPGEDPIVVPVITETSDVDFWTDLIWGLAVVGSDGEPIDWEEDPEEYLKALPGEFRNAYTSAEYVA
jgi:hypothetical protein